MQDLVQQVHITWRRLKHQFQWSLVDDETAFLDDIVHMLHTRPEPQMLGDTEINASIQQHYNQRLYAAFVAGLTDLRDDTAVESMNRASYEIYLNALRQARRREDDPHVAEEIAQKVVLRLIEKPFSVHKPGALPAWIKWQILDLLKVIRTRRPEDSFDMEDGSEISVPEGHSPIQQLDDALFLQHVLNELPKILSPLQQRVIELVILEERSGEEAASILGVKPSQVRVEKSRAIHKIRRHMQDQS